VRQIRSKPGCHTVGSATIVWLTTDAAEKNCYWYTDHLQQKVLSTFVTNFFFLFPHDPGHCMNEIVW